MPADQPISAKGHVPLNTDPLVGGSRLLGEMRGHYRIRTEQPCPDWSGRDIRFHHKPHPQERGESEIVAFLNDLAVPRNVAASPQNQAFKALIFLYKKVLGRELLDLSGLTPAVRRLGANAEYWEKERRKQVKTGKLSGGRIRSSGRCGPMAWSGWTSSPESFRMTARKRRGWQRFYM